MHAFCMFVIFNPIETKNLVVKARLHPIRLKQDGLKTCSCEFVILACFNKSDLTITGLLQLLLKMMNGTLLFKIFFMLDHERDKFHARFHRVTAYLGNNGLFLSWK